MCTFATAVVVTATTATMTATTTATMTAATTTTTTNHEIAAQNHENLLAHRCSRLNLSMLCC